MEIVYSIFIGIIASKIASKIVGIGLQCRRDSYNKHSTAAALPDGRYVDGPLKAWFRGALPRRRRGEGRL